MSYRIIIPARYASTRFPGKPLAMLGEKTILQHVYERACQSQADKVLIATDDERIGQAAAEFDAEVCMTSPDHESGTERLAEVVERLEMADNDVIVNVQGDEPFISIDSINQVASLLLDSSDAGMATLCHEINSEDEINNPNIVKVVMDKNDNALYFSRASIPWDRDKRSVMPVYRHIGLYAYSAGFLRRYITLSSCDLEKMEALEQLRVLYHGDRIKVGVTQEKVSIGIDTPEDLEKASLLI